jgi:hypothetical protein
MIRARADPRRRGRVGLAAEFCAAIADDELRVIEITPHDYRRMAELLTTYSSLRLQVVDACVIALAERLDLHEVGVGSERRQVRIRIRMRSGPGLLRSGIGRNWSLGHEPKSVRDIDL